MSRLCFKSSSIFRCPQRSCFRGRTSVSTRYHHSQTHEIFSSGEGENDWYPSYVREASKHVYDLMARNDKEELAGARAFLDCALSHSCGHCSCAWKSKSRVLQLSECPFSNSVSSIKRSQDDAPPKHHQDLISRLAAGFVAHTGIWSREKLPRNAFELSTDEAERVRAKFYSERGISASTTNKKILYGSGRRIECQPRVLSLSTIIEED